MAFLDNQETFKTRTALHLLSKDFMRRHSTAVITLVWLVVAFVVAATVRTYLENARLESIITNLVLFPFPLITRAITLAIDFALPADGAESASASLTPFVAGVLAIVALMTYAGFVALIVASAKWSIRLVKPRRLLHQESDDDSLVARDH